MTRKIVVTSENPSALDADDRTFAQIDMEDLKAEGYKLSVSRTQAGNVFIEAVR